MDANTHPKRRPRAGGAVRRGPSSINLPCHGCVFGARSERRKSATPQSVSARARQGARCCAAGTARPLLALYELSPAAGLLRVSTALRSSLQMSPAQQRAGACLAGRSAPSWNALRDI
ncbi:hypothetical protein P4O66_016896, partial [Electrophorus voltai]